MGAPSNGIIAILAEDRKAIDIKITNAFPMIGLEPISWHVTSNGTITDLSGFQHFSIPPDLRLHFSKRKKGEAPSEHLFFEASELRRLVREASRSPQALFTYIGCPITFCRRLSGKWHGVIIISPFKDSTYDIIQTRVFIDFFVHTEPDPRAIINAPLILPDMRLAYDRSGCTLGPFSYQGIQRKSQKQLALLSTVRFGFVNMSDDQSRSCYIFTSYEIRGSS